MPLLTDIRPLRHSVDYRRLWAGLTVSQLGQQMTVVAVAIQVYDITRSSLAVGLVGGFALVPLITSGLYGGALVDAVDRRLVGLVSSAGLWLVSLTLLAQAVFGLNNVGLIYGLVAVQAACYAVNNPTRQAIVPRLLPRHLLAPANALTNASFNLGMTVGPLLGGLLIAAFGVGAAYAVDCLTFTAALYAMWRLPPVLPEGKVRRAGLGSVLEGLHFLRGRHNVLMTFLADLCAMVLAQPRSLFPAIAADVYGSGARVVGLLQAAPALGALLAVATSGWLARVRRQGRAVLISVFVYGLAVASFGMVRSLWLAVAALGLAGAADMVSATFRATILQAATPDALLGRLQGVFVVVVAGGPRLGDVAMGSLTTAVVETSAITLGGLACVVALGALAARFRGFWSYDAAEPEP